MFMAFSLPVMAGAWAGIFIHEALRDAVRENRRGVRETMVIACGKCGRKLRIPSLSQSLRVTCPTCRFRFSWPLRCEQ